MASLIGRRVRVRNGRHSFVGTLQGPGTRKFPRGANGAAYGCVLEGKDFRLEFAWWDWTISPVTQRARLVAAQ